MRLTLLSVLLTGAVVMASTESYAQKKYNDGHGIYTREQSKAYWKNSERCEKLSKKVGYGEPFAKYENFEACLEDY